MTKTLQLLLISLVTYISCVQSDDACLSDNTFDYIIIGAGSTGATIASRLSETKTVRVLLLEAGADPSFVSTVPLISFKALHSYVDWNLTSVPQKHGGLLYKDGKVPLFRGKMFGGSSSLNFMTYTRGFRQDYDRWASLGNEGWGWKDIFPYMLKLEDYQPPVPDAANKPFHRRGGPLTVEIPKFKTPMAYAYLDAAKELGFPLTDYNGVNQTGFQYPPVTTRNATRCSTWISYIEPAMSRSNFVIEYHSFVIKVIINDNKMATGIQYIKNNKTCTANANREVIVSAGALLSPKVLMLSGIGPKKELEKHGIKVVLDLPGVGQNLQDHMILGAALYYMDEGVTFNSVRYETQHYLNIWEYNKTGPMAVPVTFEGVGYVDTSNPATDAWPDLEMFFNSDNAIRILKPYMKTIFTLLIPPAEDDLVIFIPILLRPKSRGTVTLQSSKPLDDPLIDPNYLSHQDDVNLLVKGLRLAIEFANTKAFQRYGSRPVVSFDIFNRVTNLLCKLIAPDVQWNSDPLECVVRLFSSTAYHQAGTCKMGNDSDKMAVVDKNLKVRGIKHLRVADASIMPYIVAAHLNVPCIMIGEKISDEIKKEWGDPVTPPLGPDPIGYN